MNFRDRDLLNLAYELDCTIRVPDVCTGGTGEPCHANWAIWGKGGAMKAHDFAFASGCRACHQAIDQGSVLTAEQREFYWLRGHVETMRQLWTRGLLYAGDFADILRSKEPETRVVPLESSGTGRVSAKRTKNLGRRKQHSTAAPLKADGSLAVVPRGNRIV